MSGIEWLVEAFGCIESKLRDRSVLENLFRDVVAAMDLKPVGRPVWHRFPEPGGVTGLWLLAESHLALHSFPEFRSVCLNLFCCRERPAPDWHKPLAERLGATDVHVSEVRRPYRKPTEYEKRGQTTFSRREKKLSDPVFEREE